MLLSVAERTSNSFFTIEGEGVRIASDGSVCVDAGASGPVRITARSGWLVNGRESVSYPSPRGLSSGLILTSKLGEDHSCSPPPPTEKEEHITNFVFSVESNPTNLIAMYALPSTSAVVTAMAHDVLLEAGRHKVMKIWEAWECSVCGAKQEARTNVSERATAPDAWTWAAAAAGRTFPTNVWSGPMSKGLGQKIEFTATGRWSQCSQCKYTTNAVVRADVHELSIERPDYLGLDRTDAGLSGRAVTNAIAHIDPEPASAIYHWTRCDKCQFVGATNEQEVTYGITNSATASTKFLAEELTVAATAKNADGRSVSATCTTNFTVVAVDIYNDNECVSYTVSDIIVGERLELSAVMAPEVSEAMYIWNIPQTIVKNWLADNEKSVVVPVEDSQYRMRMVDFCWTDKKISKKTLLTSALGEFKLTCAADFNVQSPVCSIDVDIGAIELGDNTLSFGNPERRPGVTFTASENSGLYGIFDWVQVCKSIHREHHKKSGEKIVVTSFGLDTCYPYCVGPEFSDSPQTNLAFPELSDEWVGVKVEDKFCAYLLFKSFAPGAEWVPVAKVSWGWMATANKDVNGIWRLTDSSCENPSCDLDCEEYPMWNRNVKDFKIERLSKKR